MSVLVTGCAGFIGSNVTRLLLEEGHKVFGVDNLNNAYSINLKNWRLNNLKQLNGGLNDETIEKWQQEFPLPP